MQHRVLAVIFLDVVEDVFRFLGRWVGGRVSPNLRGDGLLGRSLRTMKRLRGLPCIGRKSNGRLFIGLLLRPRAY